MYITHYRAGKWYQFTFATGSARSFAEVQNLIGGHNPLLTGFYFFNVRLVEIVFGNGQFLEFFVSINVVQLHISAQFGFAKRLYEMPENGILCAD